uniref:uncharacterized protein isoform X2 n=1 Tax=Myxine glutinosa TaxID=7769 RepID=UPI00358DF9F4
MSSEFAEFTRRNGIKHKFVSPHHQASNGLAERSVGIIKSGLQKLQVGTLETKLSRLLFKYRITPQSTTGAARSELLMKRHLRSTLDNLKPDISSNVYQSQLNQKLVHDKSSNSRCINIGDPPFARKFRAGVTWLPGDIIEKPGPLSCVIRLQDSREIRRHQDTLPAGLFPVTVSQQSLQHRHSQNNSSTRDRRGRSSRLGYPENLCERCTLHGDQRDHLGLCIHWYTATQRDHFGLCIHWSTATQRDHLGLCIHWSTAIQRDHLGLCIHLSTATQRNHLGLCIHWSTPIQRNHLGLCIHWYTATQRDHFGLCIHWSTATQRDHLGLCIHWYTATQRDHFGLCIHWSTATQRDHLGLCIHWSTAIQRDHLGLCIHWYTATQRDHVGLCIHWSTATLNAREKSTRPFESLKMFFFLTLTRSIFIIFIIVCTHIFTCFRKCCFGSILGI